jgi:hypothetical protein
MTPKTARKEIADSTWHTLEHRSSFQIHSLSQKIREATNMIMHISTDRRVTHAFILSKISLLSNEPEKIQIFRSVASSNKKTDISVKIIAKSVGRTESGPAFW